MDMIRVLIADGQAEVRWGLRMRLAIESDIAIVGEAGDVEKALSLAQALRPDVIVVDIGMRGADGVNLIRQLRAAAPAAAVVVLTLHDDQDTRTQATEAGAWAFLEKHGSAADLTEAISRLAPCLPAGTDADPLAKRQVSVGSTWNKNQDNASEMYQSAAGTLAVP
jgi:DNA-binding NarL/FixJ family response regulator